MYTATTRKYPDGTPRTKHVMTNPIVEVDEDAGTGTARSYFTVLQQVDDLPLQPVIAGRYRDEFERADGEWRFTHRHMICDLFGDLVAPPADRRQRRASPTADPRCVTPRVEFARQRHAARFSGGGGRGSAGR